MLRKDSSKSMELSNLNNEDTASGWFKTACYLASRGKASEAEIAIEKALALEENYPIAWLILAAILISVGRETDAERAGKRAIEQCKKLKITWPKLRSLIISGAIRKGEDWKSPRRVVIEAALNNEWGNILSVIGEPHHQDIDEITTIETHDKQEYEIIDDDIADTELVDDVMMPEKKSIQPDKTGSIAPQKYIQEVSAKMEASQTSRPRDTSYARTWFTAAETHMRKRDYDEAERAYKKGLEFDPLSSEGWLKLGSLLILKRKYNEAEEVLRKATRQGPGNEKAWYLYGSCLQKLERWQDAIQPLKNAINFNENNEDYWMKLGLSQYNLGQYKEAAKCFLRTLKIFPNHHDAMFYLAQCMELRGNRNHAFSLYIQLLKSGEQRPEVLEKMAGAFDRLGAADKAREARRRAVIARRRE
ncbi:tetratricopeptide repeat protein [Candidatus Thorarchaeota archaeon]|nr:MAG: tetratricopeptide repeat protein [Candidatus Thorarchaeota archaeon]